MPPNSTRASKQPRRWTEESRARLWDLRNQNSTLSWSQFGKLFFPERTVPAIVKGYSDMKLMRDRENAKEPTKANVTSSSKPSKTIKRPLTDEAITAEKRVRKRRKTIEDYHPGSDSDESVDSGDIQPNGETSSHSTRRLASKSSNDNGKPDANRPPTVLKYKNVANGQSNVLPTQPQKPGLANPLKENATSTEALVRKKTITSSNTSSAPRNVPSSIHPFKITTLRSTASTSRESSPNKSPQVQSKDAASSPKQAQSTQKSTSIQKQSQQNKSRSPSSASKQTDTTGPTPIVADKRTPTMVPRQICRPQSSPIQQKITSSVTAASTPIEVHKRSASTTVPKQTCLPESRPFQQRGTPSVIAASTPIEADKRVWPATVPKQNSLPISTPAQPRRASSVKLEPRKGYFSAPHPAPKSSSVPPLPVASSKETLPRQQNEPAFSASPPKVVGAPVSSLMREPAPSSFNVPAPTPKDSNPAPESNGHIAPVQTNGPSLPMETFEPFKSSDSARDMNDSVPPTTTGQSGPKFSKSSWAYMASYHFSITNMFRQGEQTLEENEYLQKHIEQLKVSNRAMECELRGTVKQREAEIDCLRKQLNAQEQIHKKSLESVQEQLNKNNEQHENRITALGIELAESKKESAHNLQKQLKMKDHEQETRIKALEADLAESKKTHQALAQKTTAKVKCEECVKKDQQIIQRDKRIRSMVAYETARFENWKKELEVEGMSV